MKTAKEILIDGLKAMGADGLCLILVPGEIDCGCGFDDFVPCRQDCTMCVPAKLNSEDDLYYPMEEQ